MVKDNCGNYGIGKSSEVSVEGGEPVTASVSGWQKPKDFKSFSYWCVGGNSINEGTLRGIDGYEDIEFFGDVNYDGADGDEQLSYGQDFNFELQRTQRPEQLFLG